MNFIVLVISAIIAVLAFIGLPYVIENIFITSLAKQKRLDYITGMGNTTKKNKKKKSLINSENLFNLIRISDSFRNNILLSGVNVRPEEFILIWFLSIFTLGIITFTFTVDIIRTVIVILVAVFMPPMYINLRVGQRRNLFQVQLGDALMIIANALRSGFSFAQALGSVSESLADPIKTEFSIISREVQLGIDIEEAMLGVAERMQNDDLRLLTTAVVVQQQVGGNLSDILDTLAKTIRERQKIKRFVKTLTAQGRMSGLIVGAVPVLLLVAFTFFNPIYMAPIYNTFKGHITLAVCGVLQTIGSLIIRKMVNLKL